MLHKPLTAWLAFAAQSLLLTTATAAGLKAIEYQEDDMVPSPELLEVHQNLEKTEQVQNRLGPQPYDHVNIDTWVHVIVSKKSEHAQVPDSLIHDQMGILNHFYKNASFGFNLKGIQRVENEGWAQDKDWEALRRANHRGTKSTLNLYYQLQLRRDINGVGSFPDRLESGDPKLDGAQQRIDVLPFRENRSLRWNNGSTTVHEVGHWLGLMHTFQGGCDGKGDHIDDTPAQKTPSHDCSNPKRDTCTGKGQEGFDPVFNIMNYAPGTCRYQFTPGQIERMRSLWDRYRREDDSGMPDFRKKCGNAFYPAWARCSKNSSEKEICEEIRTTIRETCQGSVPNAEECKKRMQSVNIQSLCRKDEGCVGKIKAAKGDVCRTDNNNNNNGQTPQPSQTSQSSQGGKQEGALVPMKQEAWKAMCKSVSDPFREFCGRKDVCFQSITKENEFERCNGERPSSSGECRKLFDSLRWRCTGNTEQECLSRLDEGVNKACSDGAPLKSITMGQWGDQCKAVWRRPHQACAGAKDCEMNLSDQAKKACRRERPGNKQECLNLFEDLDIDNQCYNKKDRTYSDCREKTREALEKACS